uniref:RING-type domain-containing protein n=2 Tax=Zea mays TaxID=4577 RepID=A0A804NJ95_MAIZE
MNEASRQVASHVGGRTKAKGKRKEEALHKESAQGSTLRRNKMKCNACWRDLEGQAVSTTCGHLLCADDARKILNNDGTCPICDQVLSKSHMKPMDINPGDDWTNMAMVGISPQIRLMPDSQLSTSIIAMCQNTEAISYMITYGFAVVITTRVSNELGAWNIANDRKALTVSLALSLMLGVAFLLLLGLGHDLWVRLFTISEAVVSAFASMTSLLIGSVVLDST